MMGNKNKGNRPPNFYGRQEKRMRNNFFTQQQERFGAEYWKNNQFRIEEKDCIRILKELARGNINIQDCANDILQAIIPLKNYIAKRINETFVISSCIGECNQRVHQTGNMVTTFQIETYEKYYNLNLFYNMAMNALSQFEVYPDPSILITFASNANKYIINDLY